jgi:hypothetical protein
MCTTRRNLQLNNIPPERYDNLLTSPYLPQNGGFTENDLNMRRKAEILTHNSNQLLKVNSLTKSQKYSIIVKNTTSNTPIYNNKCFKNDNGQFILTPSSSCDIPGNVIMLYNDQNIPLYNFSRGYDTKAITANKDNNYYFR